MCKPVANPSCATGNGGVWSRDEKPDGEGSHHQTQGEAKIGKVNDSEPSRDAPSRTAIETMDETMVLSHK